MSIATDQAVKDLQKALRELTQRVTALETSELPVPRETVFTGIGDLIERYKAKFGKPPHHLMKPETIVERLK